LKVTSCEPPSGGFSIDYVQWRFLIAVLLPIQDWRKLLNMPDASAPPPTASAPEAPWAIVPQPHPFEEEHSVQVLVRDNNVDQALRVLKKKMQREGVFREMKLRSHYEKPSERRVREKAEAIRRARKLKRKQMQREGLLPMKPRIVPGAPARGGSARAPRF